MIVAPRAIEKSTAPEKISVDGYVLTHTAIRELKESKILMINVLVRTSKCLNNLIEQDQLRVKQTVYPMLRFKRFGNATVTINRVKLAHRIKKEQFDTSLVEQTGVRAQELWETVSAARD